MNTLLNFFEFLLTFCYVMLGFLPVLFLGSWGQEMMERKGGMGSGAQALHIGTCACDTSLQFTRKMLMSIEK